MKTQHPTNIAVIGTGYVGLVGSAVFADWGHTVVGIDIDQRKIDSILNGIMPIFEPGLEERVAMGLENGRLRFTTSYEDGLRDADVVFICVGTPSEDSGAADLSAVLKVAELIGKNLDRYKVIVTKSTVPVGTNLLVKQAVRRFAPAEVTFDVASCPEFLAQGTSVRDMYNSDRTVIGSDSEKALEIVSNIYRHLKAPLVLMDLASAEMVKYASNAFLATKISFADSMATLCEKAGADIVHVTRGMGLDHRINPYFLNAGLGWGGSCFPKDVKALAFQASQMSLPLPLLEGTMGTNRRVHKVFFAKAVDYFGKNMSGLTFAVLGLAFKGGTDDDRESPAIKVIQRMRGAGANIRVYDPEATVKARATLGDVSIEYCDEPYTAMDGADALFILTDWQEFKGIDLVLTKSLLKNPVIFDGRNLLDMDVVQDLGFLLFAVGRQTNGLLELQKRDKSYHALLNGSSSALVTTVSPEVTN